MKFSNVWRTSALSAAVVCGLTLSIPSHSLKAAEEPGTVAKAADDDANYDRLDGMGASGKKVNVIEWEGNLEIHVYPAGSLKGLALTIDRKTKDKPVMVIGYRFMDSPGKQLIRRAIIDGISLTDNFRAYRDKSADDYDKIVITNNNLDKVLTAYKLEPKPTQLYPDGHPALVAQGDSSSNSSSDDRQPASTKAAKAKQAAADREEMEDSGTIHPFYMNSDMQGRGRHQ